MVQFLPRHDVDINEEGVFCVICLTALLVVSDKSSMDLAFMGVVAFFVQCF